MLAAIDRADDCAHVTAPTLVVTGERALDHVVPVDGSIGYVSRIRGARGVVLEQTGHLGSITRPADFAEIVRDFAGECLDRRAGLQPDRLVRAPEVA
jgi:pimeloyl-ACP methyl ester carboxylesterase